MHEMNREGGKPEYTDEGMMQIEGRIMCPRQAREATMSIQLKHQADWKKQGKICSYCGSLSQHEFFKAVEAGCEIGPTDKGYKVYLNGALAPKIDRMPKFYFQHLNEAGKKRFIRLYNAGKMNLGYPGRFYVTPYFCKPVKGPSSIQ